MAVSERYARTAQETLCLASTLTVTTAIVVSFLFLAEHCVRVYPVTQQRHVYGVVHRTVRTTFSGAYPFYRT